MKFEKTKSRIDQFWEWFSDFSRTFASDVDNAVLISELDNRVHQLDPALSWEIGPGISKPWQLVISPNLKRELREKARAIVSRAPALSAWEFHSTRQSKKWDYKLELQSAGGKEKVCLDASSWTFVLLRYPDGSHEILLKANDLPVLGDGERWEAAAIALESILGEDLVLDRISGFELVNQLEPRFAGKEKPIQHLRSALIGENNASRDSL